MLTLLQQGHVGVFALLLFALVLSLTFHEFGHAVVARYFGDDTAERAGRLTLNPLAHIDFMGLAMVVLVGFGYARPVPTDPRNFRTRSAQMWVAAAGPLMNLMLAAVSWNLYLALVGTGAEFAQQPGTQIFFLVLAKVNLLLMVFNLIPLGPLDGHYILPYLLPDRLAQVYRRYNLRYGTMALLALVVLALVGVPVFAYVLRVSDALLPWISLVPVAGI